MLKRFQTCNSFSNLGLNRSRAAQQLHQYEPKLVPRYPQDGPNVAPKRRKGVPRGPQHAPPKGPSWPQDGFKWFPGAPGRLQDEPGWPQGGPQEALRGPKMATRRPQRVPRWPQESPRRPQNGHKRGQDGAKIDHHRSRESKLKPRGPNVKNLQKQKENQCF